MFYTLFMCGHYFFNTGLPVTAFSIDYFGELVFCLSVLHVFLCHES